MVSGATVGSFVPGRTKEREMDGRSRITGREDIQEERREEEKEREI